MVRMRYPRWYASLLPFERALVDVTFWAGAIFLVWSS